MELGWKEYAGKRICVALSGGADSVCLLHLFYTHAAQHGIVLSAVHIEHGIRGDESLRDMEFCKSLCKEWEVPLEVEHCDVPALVRAGGGSVEQAARDVRYGAFRSLLKAGKADFVATAHHANDVAETVLFRLARGTGLSGMKAITEYNGIIRPLLSFTRDEILTYVHENLLPYVDDSTNADEDYTRNYIRHTVLPAFEKIHGGAMKHLVRFAAHAAEEDDFLQGLAEEKIVHCLAEEWVPVDLPEVLFYRACLACMRQSSTDGYTRANLEEIVKLRTAQSGKRVAVPMECAARGAGTRYALREGRYIVFYFDPEDGAQQSAEIPFSAAAGRYPVVSPFVVRELDKMRLDDSEKKGLYVDLDAFPEGCVVRVRQKGDIIAPYHAPRKTLKKFLSDRKISARLSKKLPVIAKGNEVFVVVGVEIADCVKVTEHTVRMGIIQ